MQAGMRAFNSRYGYQEDHVPLNYLPLMGRYNPTNAVGGYPTNPVQGFEMVNYDQ